MAINTEAANRISDQIIDIANAAPAGIGFLDILTGALLAMQAIAETAPPDPPSAFVAMVDAVEGLLFDMNVDSVRVPICKETV